MATLNIANTSNGSTYSGAWTNQNVTSVITFSDATSGINAGSLEWTATNSNWYAISNTSTSTYTDTWSGDRNTTNAGYKICDNAGNCTPKLFTLKIAYAIIYL